MEKRRQILELMCYEEANLPAFSRNRFSKSRVTVGQFFESVTFKEKGGNLAS